MHFGVHACMDTTKYERLVRQLAYQYRRFGEIEDLIQIGHLALLQAPPCPPGVLEEPHAYMHVRRALWLIARGRSRQLARVGLLSSLDFETEHGTALHELVPALELDEGARDTQVVRGMIDGLNPREREVMLARHVEGLTTAETGLLMGVTSQEVRRIEARAIERLKKRLK